MARIRKPIQPTKSILWKIALYIRLSKEDGNDESLSIINQRKILMEYVENFFDDEYMIVDAYVDDGKTGTDVNRPDFLRMERDILSGKINCIIVKSLARAFRNLGDQQKYLEEFFPLHNVRFINLGTPFIDTLKNPPTGFALEVPIYGMFNEQFAAITSEEVRKTFNTKRRNGEFIGAFAPYGYKKHPDNKNRLIIDDEAAAIIKDIFTWFLYGMKLDENYGSMSANSIARELNERGIPNPSSYKKQHGSKYQNPHARFSETYWQGSSVMRILKERMYTGCMIQGRYRIISYKIHKQIKTPESEWFVVENIHEAIIEKELFERVQQQLKRDTRAAPGKKELHLFSGLIRCADCGRSLHRRKSKNFIYYFCRTYQLSACACPKRSIEESQLEDALLQAIRIQISLIGNISHIIEQIDKAPQHNNQPSRLNMILKQKESEYIQQIKISDSLYMDWKSGDITRDEYLRMKNNTTRKADELNQIITKLKDDCQSFAPGTTAENSYFEEFKTHGNIQSLKRDILIDLVDEITLSADGQLIIKFKFADPYNQT